MNVGIIGFGYWGKNLVRNFNNLTSCNLLKVCESNVERQKFFQSQYPAIEKTADHEALINDPAIDGIVIATPVDSHYNLAKAALEAGKHVLVEKPLTGSFQQARELVELAEEKGKILMVDHTFLYHGAVKHIKEEVEKGTLGGIQYIDSTRINLGLFQHDVNVLWDLAPHDISICNYLLGKKPLSVQAVGVSHTFNDIENIAYLTLKYEGDIIAHFNCSWVSPVKIRQILIGGDKKMILFNDNEPTEKIKIYDTGYLATTDEEKTSLLVDYRVGDIHVPKVPATEALALMAADFVESCASGKTPDSSAQIGLEVVEILDAAQRSIKDNGKEVKLT